MISLKDIFNDDINLITFGGSSDKKLKRVRIKKMEGKEDPFFQEERLIDDKAYHKNISFDNLFEYVNEMIRGEFKNAVVFTDKADYYIRKTKKGKLSIAAKEPSKADVGRILHDKKKNYIIPEGKKIGFMTALGLMDDEGYVFKRHYSKYRQINRFLELVDDEWGYFKNKDEIRIVDLGCGKGYLTFALHHYFSVLKNKKTIITGIDLKSDVIDELNNIIKDLSLNNKDLSLNNEDLSLNNEDLSLNNKDLSPGGIGFMCGDIAGYEPDEPDIVVALHACDTATDIALSKAVKAGTGLIMAVPCCQHELFRQISNKAIDPILKYGIMKDKFTELATNALRGLALEAKGYDVDMIEFTSLEHTMKNIMIRAVRTGNENEEKVNEFKEFSTLVQAESSAELILG